MAANEKTVEDTSAPNSCLSLLAMDPVSSSLHPASDSSDSDVESAPSSEGQASSSESRYASVTAVYINKMHEV